MNSNKSSVDERNLQGIIAVANPPDDFQDIEDGDWIDFGKRECL